MLVSKAEILDFIPQRSPMVMVDSLLENDDKKAVSSYHISTSNIFCNEGFFTEAGIMENIAQTAALQNEYNAIQNNELVKVGFIGAVKKNENLSLTGG